MLKMQLRAAQADKAAAADTGRCRSTTLGGFSCTPDVIKHAKKSGTNRTRKVQRPTRTLHASAFAAECRTEGVEVEKKVEQEAIEDKIGTAPGAVGNADIISPT